MPTFTAHRILPDNTIFPDRIKIDTLNVTYYKGNILGYKSTVIDRKSIASVSINSRIFFADVIIETFGGKRITATGFKKSDARTIVGTLT